MSVSVHHRGRAVVASVDGDMDLETSPAVLDTLERASRDARRLLVDLTSVTFMDSSGVATLVEVYQSMLARGASFGLVGVSVAAMRVLELARLDMVFTIYPSLDAGLDDGG